MHSVAKLVCAALALAVVAWLLRDLGLFRVLPLPNPLVGRPLNDVQSEDSLTLVDTPVREDGFEGFIVDRTLTRLEFLIDVPPVKLYVRPEQVRPSHVDTGHHVRVACMYAGFMRDFEMMLASCREFKSASHCGVSKRRKFYGNQRRFILNPTDCDVFISTWDIRGAGRYSTVTYDMNAKVFPEAILHQYGDQLAVLHMQKYESYLPLWKAMHFFRRAFPQTRPVKLSLNRSSDDASWSGNPETNGFLRRNDYSQSYKQWCVMQLVLTFSTHYDVYFRLRTDLRATRRFEDIHFNDEVGRPKSNLSVAFRLVADSVAPGGVDEDEKLAQYRNSIVHFVHSSRIHVNHFDIADFGFLGSLSIIQELASIWPRYCATNSTSRVSKVVHGMFSEYNYMVWRIIFDNKWEVDSGRRYLWISRKSLPQKGSSSKKKVPRRR